MPSLPDDDEDLIGDGPVQLESRRTSVTRALEQIVAHNKANPQPKYGAYGKQIVDHATGVRQENAAEVESHIERVNNGVSTSWLAQAFHMDPKTVRARLARCPVKSQYKSGNLYDLSEAAQYLVKPVIDLDEYLRSVKVEDLPTRFQSQYWDAMMKRQKWEENAKHLWRSEDVLSVLGDAFMAIKSGLLLFIDNIERQTGVTEDQREIILSLVDTLQKDLHTKMVEMPSKRSTKRERGRPAHEPPKPEGYDEVVVEDDDGANLI